jgi:hypothetical protein
MSNKLPDQFTDHLGNKCTVISEHIKRVDGVPHITYKWWVWFDTDKTAGVWEFQEEQRADVIHKITTGKYKRGDLCL